GGVWRWGSAAASSPWAASSRSCSPSSTGRDRGASTSRSWGSGRPGGTRASCCWLAEDAHKRVSAAGGVRGPFLGPRIKIELEDLERRKQSRSPEHPARLLS